MQFSPALGTLIDDGFELFIEIGPHPVLRDYVNQIAQAKGAETTAITTLRRPTAAQPELELEAVSTAICACYANGGADPKTIFHAPRRWLCFPPIRGRSNLSGPAGCRWSAAARISVSNSIRCSAAAWPAPIHHGGRPPIPICPRICVIMRCKARSSIRPLPIWKWP